LKSRKVFVQFTNDVVLLWYARFIIHYYYWRIGQHFPSQASEILLESLPTRWRKGEAITCITFRQTFDDCCLWFNHIIKVEDSNVIRPEFLWKYVTRGAMIVCKDNQEGVDIIVPVVFPNGKLSRQNVTAIVIQVKNATDYGLKVKNKLFDAMDPCGLGLLSDNPRPIIRVVFALVRVTAALVELNMFNHVESWHTTSRNAYFYFRARILNSSLQCAHRQKQEGRISLIWVVFVRNVSLKLKLELYAVVDFSMDKLDIHNSEVLSST
jgi:hypothetical protein